MSEYNSTEWDYHMSPLPEGGEFNPDAVIVLLIVGLVCFVVLIIVLWREEHLLINTPTQNSIKEGVNNIKKIFWRLKEELLKLRQRLTRKKEN